MLVKEERGERGLEQRGCRGKKEKDIVLFSCLSIFELFVQ